MNECVCVHVCEGGVAEGVSNRILKEMMMIAQILFLSSSYFQSNHTNNNSNTLSLYPWERTHLSCDVSRHSGVTVLKSMLDIVKGNTYYSRKK